MKKFLLKATSSVLKSVLLLVVLVSSGVLAPIFHKTFMRQYAGSKVFKVLKPGAGGGTGFHVQAKSGKTFLLTNAHVCNVARHSDFMYVDMGDGGDYVPHKIVKRGKTHDLCALEPVKGIKGLRVAKRYFIGEYVGLIGHPGLRPLTLSIGEIIGHNQLNLLFGMDLPNRLCIGKNIRTEEINNPLLKVMLTINGIKKACFASLKTVMLNAIAYKGNSGSPVIDIFGQVVGVLFAGSNQVTDSHLVPLNEIHKFLGDL